MNRRHRLAGSARFAAVRAGRATGRSGPLRVHAAASDVEVMRAGFAIPRGVGGAVVRNRVRRRLRALLAARAGRAAGYDLVVAVAAPVAELSAAQLAGDLDRCLAGALTRAGRHAEEPEGAAR